MREITVKERVQILEHAMGMGQSGAGVSRNYFCTGPGGRDYEICRALVAEGFMVEGPGSALTGGSPLFQCKREAAREYVRANQPPMVTAPKLTRSQQRYRNFLRADCGMTFGEYLRYRGA